MLLHIYYFFVQASILMFILWIIRASCNEKIRMFFKNKPSRSKDGKYIALGQAVILLLVPILHIFMACFLLYIFVADEDNVIKLFKMCN